MVTSKCVFVIPYKHLYIYIYICSSSQAGITNRFEYPMLMDQLAEKTFVFKVKWQPRWKSCSVVCYKEGPEFVNQVVARFPNVVVI
jgi:hypothetical protein